MSGDRKMRVHVAVAAVLGLALATTAYADDQVRPQKPNVLFIVIDDLNDWVGCMGGHPQTSTPNINRLAKTGMLFTNAYCAAPSCNPSRSAILSGRPPYRTGLYQNSQILRDVMPTAELLPSYFSRHGYWSAGSGKILHYIIDPRSWDDYFPEKEKDDPFPRTFEPTVRPVSLPRGGPWQYVDTDWGALDVSDEELGGDWLVTKWIGEQLQRAPGKPSFLACGIYRPHEPWFVPKKYFEPFPLASIEPGPGYKPGDVDDLPPSGQKLARNRYFEHIQKQGRWKQAIQAYLASIYYADAMVGRVLDALEKSPNGGNTIVVLFSDHGWHVGEKEHWQKYTGWRIGSRVPLIVRVPKGAPGLREGTVAGSICTRPVSLTDLFGTLTELCGLPAKADVQSHSFVPLLRDPDAQWPHAAITHLDHPESYAISTERWRYIHYRNGDEELYDIQTDPYEWTNLATDSEQAAQIARMRALAPTAMAPVHETEPGISDFTAEATLELIRPRAAKCPASQPSTRKVTVLVRNQREAPFRLVWVDDKGKHHDHGVLPKAGRRLIHTFAGHAWLVADDTGTEFGHFVVGEAPAQVSTQ
jgi:arylsulfatase A-like enzyme